MYAAASCSTLSIVKLLLDHGADASVKSWAGQTAREIARQQKRPVVADYLDAIANTTGSAMQLDARKMLAAATGGGKEEMRRVGSGREGRASTIAAEMPEDRNLSSTSVSGRTVDD